MNKKLWTVIVLGISVIASSVAFLTTLDASSTAIDAAACRNGSMEACKAVLLTYRSARTDREFARKALGENGTKYTDPTLDTPVQKATAATDVLLTWSY